MTLHVFRLVFENRQRKVRKKKLKNGLRLHVLSEDVQLYSEAVTLRNPGSGEN